ncbi:MAG: hypothetical protein EA397_17885 [Deltaproteobacteria bacterium]|nr:MAG: hypothetical protein EA397_17885 [Deltaproteobacteria bacterium]
MSIFGSRRTCRVIWPLETEAVLVAAPLGGSLDVMYDQKSEGSLAVVLAMKVHGDACRRS